MKKENIEQSECCQEKFMSKCHHGCHSGNGGTGSSCAIYGLGVVGALFYFLQNAATFGYCFKNSHSVLFVLL